MRLLRRRAPTETLPAVAQMADEADRIERAVRALAEHTSALEDRLGRLEARVADVEDRAREVAALPPAAAAQLQLVGADLEATAVTAEAGGLVHELEAMGAGPMTQLMAEQVAGLADSLDTLAAALASSTDDDQRPPLAAVS